MPRQGWVLLHVSAMWGFRMSTVVDVDEIGVNGGDLFACGRSLGPPSAKGMNGPGSGNDFPAMAHSSGDEVFVARTQRNAFIIKDKSVGAVNDDHIFVEVMHVRSGNGCLMAGPERHLSSIRAVENIALDARSRLTGNRYFV